jgi:ABC-2 type transport system permease protein
MYQKQLTQRQNQQQLISVFYWLNPYLLTRDLSMAIAGTDSWHFYDYEMQSETHRYQRIEKLNHIHATHIDAAHDRGSTADASLWQQFQHFEYQMPSLDQSLAPYRYIWPLPLVLILVGIGFVTNGRVKRRVYALA